jgi:glycosyltransferase involved in cell wall biosynthesis
MLYVHGEDIGYARAGSYIANGLTDRGVTVYDDHGQEWEKRTWSMQKLHGHRTIPKSPTNLMCLVSVPSHIEGHYDAQYVSILTMWEAKRLPESFREVFHEFDMLLVPSQQNVELFSEYHDNVQLILLGVDPKVWHYEPTVPVGPEFRFLISGRGSRKGVDLAYKAFRKVFPGAKPTKNGMPIPKLVMKATRGHGDYFAPGIEQVTGKLPAEQEAELYRTSHCYLQPSRGEGFGLQPLQAMAMGRPTILTNAHGHASFAHLGIPISAGSSKADYFIYGDAGEWWEPDLDELCEAMWDVYHNYGSHIERAALSAKEVAEHFTWDNTLDRFQQLLGEQMSVPYQGNGEWQTPTANLYRIVTNQDWPGEIAGRSVFFRKGVEYWDMADVKRILYDAGVLDHTCVMDNDHGLSPIQVEQRDSYVASAETCPSCGQILNSGVKRSDLIFEGMQNGQG